LKKEQEPAIKLQNEINSVQKQSEILQQNIDQLTENYGKEIATLKAKLAQQNAELSIKNEEIFENFSETSTSKKSPFSIGKPLVKGSFIGNPTTGFK